MSKLCEMAKQHRQNKYGSSQMFLGRWSPRAMTGQSVSDADLMAMFEAAHWAPSSYNNQPWRFIYAKRNQPDWNRFYDLLMDANQIWCRNAAALIVIVTKMTFDHNGKPAFTSPFDTGAAWGMFALEGAARGLVVHGMQGFDYERARVELGIPDKYEIQARAAVGVLGDTTTLPQPLQEREIPSLRKDLTKLVAVGQFTDELL